MIYIRQSSKPDLISLNIRPTGNDFNYKEFHHLALKHGIKYARVKKEYYKNYSRTLDGKSLFLRDRDFLLNYGKKKYKYELYKLTLRVEN